jgi:hypothetical protein
MKSQEIFDTVATHLFAQGERALAAVRPPSAYGTPPICAYRGTEGRSCAIGCLIPDDLYSEAMEGGGITEDFIKRFKLPAYFAENRRLLLNLQSVHDTKSPWVSTYTMQETLRTVARSFELDSSIVDTLSFKDR